MTINLFTSNFQYNNWNWNKYLYSINKTEFYEKMLNITHYPRNANQRGTTTRQSEWLLSKSLQAINAEEGVEQREPSYTVGGNANQYSHYGKQCGDFLKNWK